MSAKDPEPSETHAADRPDADADAVADGVADPVSSPSRPAELPERFWHEDAGMVRTEELV